MRGGHPCEDGGCAELRPSSDLVNHLPSHEAKAASDRPWWRPKPGRLKRNQPGRSMEERTEQVTEVEPGELVEEFVGQADGGRRVGGGGCQPSRQGRGEPSRLGRSLTRPVVVAAGQAIVEDEDDQVKVMEDEDDREGSGGRSSAGQGWQTTEQVEEEEAEQVDDEDHRAGGGGRSRAGGG
ncbi:hypothetical protein Dimus_030173 [Dionaea muscipula]